MRAIVQRVRGASVTVDDAVISSIGKGLMVLVGIGRDDTAADLEDLAKQILSLKVFSDEASGTMWKKNVQDINGEVLCVSQFTLFATAVKGKPDFHRAMATGPSRNLYASFLERMSEMYRPDKVKDGRFGAMMDVRLTNEGPVTFTLDSKKLTSETSKKSRKSTPTASGTRMSRAQPPFSGDFQAVSSTSEP